MPGNLTEELARRKLARYLADRISLRQLNHWLVDVITSLDGRADRGLRDLVYGIELRIAEYTSGVWTEAELRGKLAPLVTSFETSFDGPHPFPEVRRPVVVGFRRSGASARPVAASV